MVVGHGEAQARGDLEAASGREHAERGGPHGVLGGKLEKAMVGPARVRGLGGSQDEVPLEKVVLQGVRLDPRRGALQEALVLLEEALARGPAQLKRAAV